MDDLIDFGHFCTLLYLVGITLTGSDSLATLGDVDTTRHRLRPTSRNTPLFIKSSFCLLAIMLSPVSVVGGADYEPIKVDYKLI